MAGNGVIEINGDNFQNKVVESDLPVLVDFWAEWCAPCRMIAPIVEELAVEFDGKLTVGKVNVDTDGHIAAKYGIRGIPTLILFKNGKPVSQTVGAAPKSQLRKWLNENI